MAMNVDDRVRRQIGDLVIQIHVLQHQVETLTEKLAEYEAKEPEKPPSDA